MEERQKALPQVVLFLVAREDGRILFEERSEEGDSFYGVTLVPSGKRKRDESVDEALVRELQEELGIEPVVVVNLGEMILESGYLAGAFVVTKYRGEAWNKKGRNIQKWLFPDEADRVLKLASSQLCLKRARRFISRPSQSSEGWKTD